MWNNGHDAYLESRVLSADPVELVNMLYQASTQAVRDARVHLAEGRIMERTRAINRACQINIELSAARFPIGPMVGSAHAPAQLVDSERVRSDRRDR